MVTFGLGHAALLVMLHAAGPSYAHLAQAHRLALALGLLALASLAVSAFKQGSGKLFLPVCVYVAVLGVLGLTGLSLPAQAAIAVLPGLCAFLLSDLLIGIQSFTTRAQSAGWSVLIWLLYWIGLVWLLAGLT